MITLSLLAHRTPARVVSFADGADCRLDLMQLGIVPGARVEVVRQAPFGGPLQVNVIGAHMALRAGVASSVIVEPL